MIKTMVIKDHLFGHLTPPRLSELIFGSRQSGQIVLMMMARIDKRFCSEFMGIHFRIRSCQGFEQEGVSGESAALHLANLQASVSGNSRLPLRTIRIARVVPFVGHHLVPISSEACRSWGTL